LEEMERIAASKARKEFRSVIRRASAEGKRVKITHYGKTLAGLISAKDLAKLEDCEARSKASPKRSRSRG
jgi:prevent-host-death family protein